MLAPSASAPHRASPLPSAVLAAELGPAVMADDPCEAAFGSADPTGPRKYYRARYYDPKLGRFISEDPIGLNGRDVNYYAYVKNNPARYKDPSSLYWQDANAEMQRSWNPFRAPFDASDVFPNGPHATRDKERNCYVSCLQLKCTGPLLSCPI